ncbi:hypothetical protein G7046_g1890 [Stylonectria norvegica]|nr:hypothetical protein G7046_g1890 [Stylonectria norvegica]
MAILAQESPSRTSSRSNQASRSSHNVPSLYQAQPSPFSDSDSETPRPRRSRRVPDLPTTPSSDGPVQGARAPLRGAPRDSSPTKDAGERSRAPRMRPAVQLTPAPATAATGDPDRKQQSPTKAQQHQVVVVDDDFSGHEHHCNTASLQLGLLCTAAFAVGFFAREVIEVMKSHTGVVGQSSHPNPPDSAKAAPEEGSRSLGSNRAVHLKAPQGLRGFQAWGTRLLWHTARNVLQSLDQLNEGSWTCPSREETEEWERRTDLGKPKSSSPPAKALPALQPCEPGHRRAAVENTGLAPTGPGRGSLQM